MTGNKNTRSSSNKKDDDKKPTAKVASPMKAALPANAAKSKVKEEKTATGKGSCIPKKSKTSSAMLPCFPFSAPSFFAAVSGQASAGGSIAVSFGAAGLGSATRFGAASLSLSSNSTSTTSSSNDSGIDFAALSSLFSPNCMVANTSMGAGNSSTGLLAKFGLAAAPVTAVAATAPGGNGLNKDSTLKVAIIIVNPNLSIVVLCCEPNNPAMRSGSWSEKILFDKLPPHEQQHTEVDA